MYPARSQQDDEHKGAPVQAHYDGGNANPLEPILDTLLVREGNNSEEWLLLQYLAWLAPEFTSEELLLAILGNDQNKLRKAIRNLEKLSLVSTICNGDVRGVTIHHKLQDDIVKYATNSPRVSKEIHELLVDISVLLNEFMPEIIGKHDEKREIAKTYTLTVEALFWHSNTRGMPIPENEEVACLNVKLGMVYRDIFQNFRKGLAYSKKALVIYQSLYQESNADVAWALNNVGVTYDILGDFEKSLVYFKKALVIYQSLYEGNHQDIAWTLNSMGDTYANMGKINRGLAYFNRALVMYQAIYGEDNSDVAGALMPVGAAHSALGDVNKGLTYFERALTIYQSLYEENHPDVARSLSYVGDAYYILGDINKGLAYKERALAMRLFIYGSNHHYLIKSLNSVGLAYKNLGDIGKYILYARQALLGDGFIKKRGLITEDIISVKQKLQKEVLNEIQVLSSEGKWNKKSGVLNFGILNYLDKGYLKRQLGSLNNAKNIKIALSLCFEAINIGIANSKKQDPRCAMEFVRAYPKLVREIVIEHPEYFVGENIAAACLNKAEYDMVTMPAVLNPELKEEFKGSGLLDYTGESYYEYYNTAIDKILGMRLGLVSPQIKRLDSWYLVENRASVAELTYKISNEFSNEVELVIVPASLQGKHWLGLLFRKSGNVVEVIYMDPEQEAMVQGLKLGVEYGFSMNGYTSQFSEAKLERQRYNNCGLEVIENFIHYLTGTRATQEGAIYVHSLLVENSLLDPKKYVSKLEENNRLLGFLSNAAPLAIRSMGASPNVKPITIHLNRVMKEDVLPLTANNDEVMLNLLPAIEQFNKLWGKWVQDKLQQINVVVYKATLGFKGLDLMVDSARLVYEPGLDKAKKIALDVSYLYGLYSGANGYSIAISGAEVVYQLHMGEYKEAFDIAASTLSAMALPLILAHANRPYLGFVYSLAIAASTAYNTVENAYSFALELTEGSEVLSFEFMAGQVMGHGDNSY